MSALQAAQTCAEGTAFARMLVASQHEPGNPEREEWEQAVREMFQTWYGRELIDFIRVCQDTMNIASEVLNSGNYGHIE